MKLLWNKYLILLLSFFQPMIINIGGEVSPSFLFILFTSPFWFPQLKFRRDRFLRYFTILFVLLLAVQVAWIPFAHTGLFIQIKGIMVTISGLAYFLYFYLVMRKNPMVVKWIVLGTFLASFVFINVLVEREGSEFGLWKFQIMPRLVTAILLVYLWFSDSQKMQKVAPCLLVGIGLLGLVTGARSSGLVPLISGGLFFLLQVNNSVKSKSLKSYFFIGLALFYGLYVCIYVPNVLNGNITGGNSGQLQKLENPYNPLNLLMVGRKDAIIPFIAFRDRPITGWGYYTPDPKRHYLNRMLKMSSENEKKRLVSGMQLSNSIPGHGIWGYYSCSYGIIAFCVFCLLIKKVWELTYKSLYSKDKYLLYRIFVLFSVSWNLLFSPMSHFKTLPMNMAILLVLSIIAMERGYKKDVKCL